MKILTLIKIVAIATLFSSSTSYATESYSAIASTDGWAYGHAVGYPSQNNADVTALNECHSRRKGQCSIEYRFRGPGCIAFARGHDGTAGWGAGHGYSNNRSVAQNGAMNKCNRLGGSGCSVENTDCTDS